MIRLYTEGNVRIGWGIGKKDRHYLSDYSKIIKKITNILELRPKNVFYYGSSAGGFMTMILACKHKYTTAIVNNPQTYVFNFHRSHLEDMKKHIFEGISEKNIIENYYERFSVVQNFIDEDYIPRVYYFQNRKCENDMERHFNPFVQDLKNNDLNERKLVYILYNNDKLGHDPLPKETAIANINSIIATAGIQF